MEWCFRLIIIIVFTQNESLIHKVFLATDTKLKIHYKWPHHMYINQPVIRMEMMFFVADVLKPNVLRTIVACT